MYVTLNGWGDKLPPIGVWAFDPTYKQFFVRTGKNHPPKKGEYFWNPIANSVTQATVDHIGLNPEKEMLPVEMTVRVRSDIDKTLSIPFKYDRKKCDDCYLSHSELNESTCLSTDDEGNYIEVLLSDSRVVFVYSIDVDVLDMTEERIRKHVEDSDYY